jgi:hypothetical protein
MNRKTIKVRQSTDVAKLLQALKPIQSEDLQAVLGDTNTELKNLNTLAYWLSEAENILRRL